MKFLSSITAGGVRNLLVYFAFAIFSISQLMESSSLFNFGPYVHNVLSVVACILLVIRFLATKHTKKELLIVGAFCALVVTLCVMGAPLFLLTSGLLFANIKGIHIKTLVKIDLWIKAIFLSTHALLFLLDYTFNIGDIGNFVFESAKGISYALYFKNPNTTGLIGVWFVIELLYIKNDKRFVDYILPTLLVVIIFAITKSRTPFAIYFVYLILQLVKSDKILVIIEKSLFPILICVSLFIVLCLDMNSSAAEFLNVFFSGRLSHSVLAYKMAGMHLLPFAGNELINNVTVDNFFAECFIRYGIIVLMLYNSLWFFVPNNTSKENKRISIITALYLFFEKTIAFTGFALPIIIIMDSIINKRTDRSTG